MQSGCLTSGSRVGEFRENLGGIEAAVSPARRDPGGPVRRRGWARPAWGLVTAVGLWLTGLLSLTHGASATTATLLLSAAAARPGTTVLAGIRLQMTAGWHVYWRNPGESGIATSIEWHLPPGITAGEVQWPPPETITASDITTYVYGGETVLLVPLHLAPDLAPGPKHLEANVSWLECAQLCVPGDATVSATLDVGTSTSPSAAASLLATWEQRVVRSNPALEARAAWGKPASPEATPLMIEGVAWQGFRPTQFLPYGGPDYEIKPATTILPANPGRFRLQVTAKQSGKALPLEVSGLLLQPATGSQPLRAFEVGLNPGGGSVGSVPHSPAGGVAATAGGSLAVMLGLAFLGGLILNVMPCVLPVIALKILSFVQQSKEAPQRVRRLGAMYGLGVVVSFLALAAMVIGVQRAGGAASWGMQMQNPYFRLALTVLVTLVALNLFGLFEINLGGSAMGAAAAWAGKEGTVGAFFNGVLTTALATPCTAPFLTVALGFAFTQSPLIIVLMFVTTALGLAAPYVALSWHPAWLRLLPKPGPWMARFKVGMGFPMLATAIWLFDLTTPPFGDGATLWLGVLLVLLALAAWTWGEFVQRGDRRKPLAATLCFLLVGGGYGFILEGQLHWRHPTPLSTSTEVVQDSPEGIRWRRWSPEAVETARNQGHPVLVDFTARWCFTCKTNKKFAIDVAAVRAKLQAINAVAFRADDTDPSPAIAAELRRYGRAGVPLVLVFSRQSAQPPQVLPAVLTPRLVLDALAKAVE